MSHVEANFKSLCLAMLEFLFQYLVISLLPPSSNRFFNLIYLVTDLIRLSLGSPMSIIGLVGLS